MQSKLFPNLMVIILLTVTNHLFSATITVDNLGDVDDGNYAAGQLTLREAINLTNTNGVSDLIDFSVSGTIFLTSNLPTIIEGVTINGGANITIEKDGGAVFTISNVSDGRIYNMILQDPNANNNTVGVRYQNGCIKSEVAGMTFTNMATAVEASQGEELIIKNSTFNNCGGGSFYAININGVLVHAASSKRLDMFANTFNGGGNAIAFANMDNLDIQNTGTGAEVNLPGNDGRSSMAGTVLSLNNCDNQTLSNINLSYTGGTTAGTGIFLTACDNISISGFTINDRFNGIQSTNCSALVIQNNTIDNILVNNAGNGINVSGGQDVQILDNTIKEQGRATNTYALRVQDVVDDGSGNRLIVNGTTFMGGGSSVFLSNMDALTIDNVLTASPGQGVHLPDTDGRQGMHGLNLSLNNIDNITLSNFNLSYTAGTTAGTGIVLTSCDNISISGFTINDRFNGIQSSNCSAFVIQNNTIDNILVNNAGNGINVSGGQDVQILDNTLKEQGRATNTYALRVDGVIDNGSGQRLIVNGTTFMGGGNSVFLSNMDALTIDNVLTASPGQGVHLPDTDGRQGMHGFNLSLNNIDNITLSNFNLSYTAGTTAGTGMALTSCDNISISGFTINDRFSGIQSTNCSAFIIQNNTIDNILVNNAGNGINVSGGQDIQILDNTIKEQGRATNTYALRVDGVVDNGSGQRLIVNGTTFMGGGNSVFLSNMDALTIDNVLTASPGQGVHLPDTDGRQGMYGFNMNLSNIDNTTLSNFNLSYTGGTTLGFGINLNACDNILISGFTINDRFTGIQSTNCSAIVIQNNTIDNILVNNAGNGIFVSGGQDVQLINNTIKEYGKASNTYALRFNNVSDNGSGQRLNVSGTTFIGGGHGISLESMDDVKIHHTSQAGTELLFPVADGKETLTGNVLTLSNITNTIVDGFNLSHTGGTNIGLGINCVNSSNIIFQNLTIHNRDNGILLSGGTANQILNNDLMDIDNTGIRALNTSNIIISGNSFNTGFNVGTNASLVLDGVTLDSGNRVTAANNDWKNVEVGVRVNNMDNFIISDGTVANTEMTIVTNDSLFNSTICLFIDNSDGVQVENLFLGQKGASISGSGVYIEDGSNAIIRGVSVIGRNEGVKFRRGQGFLVDQCLLQDNNTGVIGELNSGGNTTVTVSNTNFSCNGNAIHASNDCDITASNNFWGQSDGSSTDSGSGDSYSFATTLNQEGSVSGTTTFLATADGTSPIQSPMAGVSGNAMAISNGQVVTSTADHTDFDQVAVGNNLMRTFTIGNSGVDDLNITSISSSDAEFVVSGAPTAVSGAGNETFTVTFTPSSITNFTASITIVHDDCYEDPYTFALAGEGISACDLSMSAPTITHEVCPGADDGEITINATCTSCTTIEYAIDEVNGGAYQASATFSNLPDGVYTLRARDSGDISCNASSSGTVNAGVDSTDPFFQDPSEVTLYTNDFESPTTTPLTNFCNADLSQESVNALYTTGGFIFDQTFTVETTTLNGSHPVNPFQDPTGIGGNHSITMLSSTENDLLSLTFDRQGLNFLNVRMDISAIGLPLCYTVDPTTPTFELRVYDTPSGTFDVGNITETLLSSTIVTGVAPNPSNPKYILNWSEALAGLDVSGATNNNISLVWDMTAGGFGTFDNVEITASNSSIISNLPDDITIQCLADLPAVPTVTAFDDCDPNPTVTFVQNPASPTGNDQTITRTWTATDASSNQAQGVQIITIDDVTDPSFTCPSVQNVSLDASCMITIPDLISGITDEADNCGTVTLSQNPTAGTMQNAVHNDVVNVTITANDGNGNTSDCMVALTVQDVTSPTISCNDISVNLNAAGTYTLTQTDLAALAAGSSDDCSAFANLTIVSTPNTFNCNDVVGQANNFALSFDETTSGNGADYVVSTQNVGITGQQPRTLEFWIRMNETNVFNEHIINWGQSIQGGAFGFYQTNNSELEFYTHDSPGGWDYSTGHFFDALQWYHIAATYDGVDNISVYVNGQPAPNPTYQLPGFPNTADSPLYLAVREDLASATFSTIDLDEVRIWNYARTQAEIIADMNSALNGNEPGLVLYYDMENNGPGTTQVIDASPNANHGTLTQMDPANDWINSGSPVFSGGTPVVLEVTDEAGNTTTSTCAVNVFVQTNLSISATPTGETCLDNADGQIVASVTGGTGPYTFTLTRQGTGGITTINGSSPQTFTGLVADDYILEIEDQGGCIGSTTTTVDASVTPCCDIAIISATPTDEVCPGADDGEITINATCTSCTTIEYAIDEVNGGAYQASATFSNLPDGVYTLRARDSGDISCNASSSGTVNAGVDTTPPSFEDASNVVLSTQDFESPVSTPTDGTDNFLDVTIQQTVTQIFGPDFLQRHTVETLLNNGPNNVYTDPTGQAGNYSLGIWNANGQDDLMGFKFDKQGRSFLNVEFDLSPIGLTWDGTTLFVDGQYTSLPNQPQMRVAIYDNPTDAFNINNPGASTLLDETTLVGLNSNGDFTYNWSRVLAGLDASAATNNNVVLVFDLLGVINSYASIDNIEIFASNTSATNTLPEDITIQCLADLPAVPTVTAFDDCDPNPTVTFVQNPASPTGNDQTITRTWTATDASSNQAQGVQIITIDDVTDPALSIPGNMTFSVNDGCTVTGYNLGTASATDNCNGSITPSNNAPTALPIGQTTVTWTADDGNGNIVTDDQIVTVIASDINIQGNGMNIANGDDTPSLTDDTDFGDQMSNTSTFKQFTIQNLGTATLNLTGSPDIVTISGASEFTILTQPTANNITSGGTDLSFVVEYNPTSAGMHTATVSISSDDCDEGTYTFDVYGEVLCDIALGTPTITHEVCPGDDNGTITIIATCTSCTGIEYAIDGVNGGAYQASPTFSNLAPNTYTIRVRDTGDFSCNDSGSAIVNPSTNDLAVNGSVTDQYCPVTQDGAVDITPTGGSTSYSFSWENAANPGTEISTMEDLTGLAAGTYNVTVSDGTCQVTDSYVVGLTNPTVQTWYIDADGDGFGSTEVMDCDRPTDGYLLTELNPISTGTDDCNDGVGTIYPGAPENTTNGIDDDCDGAIDEVPTVTWIPVANGDNNGSCVGATDCCTQTFCFALVYNPANNGTLTSYTTGFLMDCVNNENSVTANASCVMDDNSGELVDCNNEGVLMNSSGINGTVEVLVNHPITIHQICVTVLDNETLTLMEDIVTDISTSINLTIGGSTTEFPEFGGLTIEGNKPPVVTSGTIGACYPSVAAAEAAAIAATSATDDCVGTITYSASTSGTCSATITVTAADACGLTSSVMYTTRIDGNGPSKTGNANLTIVNGCSIADAPAAATTVAELEALDGITDVSDDCTLDGDLTVTHTETSTATCPIIITRVYTIKDECGNELTINHNILINDIDAPVITGSLGNVTIDGCDASAAPAPVGDVASLEALDGTLDVSDLCRPDNELTVTVVDSAPSGSCPIVITRTYTITDECQNSSTVSQVITIVPPDNIMEMGGPVATSQTVVTELDATPPGTLPTIVDGCGTTLIPSTPVIGGTFTSGDCKGTITYTYTYTDCVGRTFDWTFTNNVDCGSLNIKVFLEGAYDVNGDTMTTTLNEYHLLPGEDKFLATPLGIKFGAPYTPFGHPYSIAPWNYNGNLGNTFGEPTAPGAPANVTPYPEHVVDWILVSVRENGTLPADEVFKCAGWVHKNGDVTFPEACPSSLTINGGNEYYVVIEHRNHLVALDTATIVNGNEYLELDFTSSNSYATGIRQGQAPLEAGVWGLFHSNIEQIISRAAINSVDNTAWKFDQGNAGYFNGDVNLNGTTNSEDETKWKQNQNTSTAVINN